MPTPIPFPNYLDDATLYLHFEDGREEQVEDFYYDGIDIEEMFTIEDPDTKYNSMEDLKKAGVTSISYSNYSSISVKEMNEILTERKERNEAA